MAIKITRGVRGIASTYIAFVGSTSDGVHAVNPVSNVLNITAQLNVEDSTCVDVVNDSQSFNVGYTSFEIFCIPFDEWVDNDDQSFTTAQEVVDYINTQVQISIDSAQESVAAPLGIATSLQVAQNTPFTYSAAQNDGIGYFWDDTYLPNGVEVNRSDRRKISGIITQTGSYALYYDVANRAGTSAQVLTITVV